MHTRLTTRGQGFVRAVDARHPYLWDGALTFLWLCAALTDYHGGGWRTVALDPRVADGLVLALSLGFTVPLFWRRRHPFAVLLAISPFLLLNSLSGASLQAGLLQILVVFHIALRLPSRTLWWSLALTAAPLVAGALRFPEAGWSKTVVQPLWLAVIAVLLGTVVRGRREYTAALVERARRLETERDQQARLSAAAERARIAREMHDIIGHNLSVITGLADGGAYAARKSPERAAEALEAIAATSRQALGELRRVLDVLREDPSSAPTAELTPQPALADLDALVERVRAAGLTVDAALHGTPDDVPPGLQLTVYRLVQEALTNTMKHAGPGTSARVRVDYAADHVSVRVTDSGPCRPAPTTADGSGRGLTGMRERTALYRGTLDAGPVTDGHGRSTGWRVHARLPLTEEVPT